MTRVLARALAALLLVSSLAGCGGGGDEAAPATTTTVAPTTTERETTTTTAPVARTTVARAEVDVVDVYADATGDEIVHELDRRETVTQNIVFVVDELATSPAGRHLVQLPVRPNGSTGWVDAADVSITSHDFRIEVALSDFELRLYKAGEVLVEAPIGVGQQDRPTPPGTYYITELLRPTDAPNGPYGSYAYGLSGFSEVLFEFGGGPGQLGLHGTNQPEAIGTEVSSGCIRVRNEVIEDFVEGIGLPLGVPVEISA